MGGLIGGFTMKGLGSTMTFRVFAIVAAATALAYEMIVQLRNCFQSDKPTSELSQDKISKPTPPDVPCDESELQPMKSDNLNGCVSQK